MSRQCSFLLKRSRYLRCRIFPAILVSLLSFACVRHTSGASVLQAAANGIQGGVTSVRNSEAVENIQARAWELFSRGKPAPSPPLELLSAELEGIGLGASCLLDYATEQGAKQGAYLLAVASKTDGMKRFAGRFQGANQPAYRKAVAELAKHVDLLSGAVPLPSTANQSGFLSSEVSAIRPLVFSLSIAFAKALEKGDRQFLSEFLRSDLPKLRKLFHMLLKLMDDEDSKQVRRKRRMMTSWIALWFEMDIALLASCPAADSEEVEARRALADKVAAAFKY